MTNIYELSEELGLTPKTLQKWLRSHGFGSGKTISHRATREAKTHFNPTTDHPMASALQEREGLGEVKRHEDLVHLSSGVKVEERPQLKWSNVERNDVDVLQMDMGTQKDFFKQLRQSEASQEKIPVPQETKVLSSTSKAVPIPPAKPKGIGQPRKRPSEAQVNHSIFGSLASKATHLDSVTDRPRTSNMDQGEVIKLMKQGTRPIDRSNETPKSKRTKAKKNKKRGRQQSTQVIETSKSNIEPTFQDLFERPEVQSLSAKLDQLKSKNQSLQDENESLRTMIGQLKQVEESRLLQDEQSSQTVSLSSHTPSLTQPEPTLVWSHFESFGLNVNQARFAFLELLDHPQRGPELMYSLKHDQPQTLTRGFAIVCEADVCREVADTFARQGLIEFGEKHLCSICQGSDGRGWYKRLLLTATHTKRTKILIVGGDDHIHQQLKQLNREQAGIQWEFVIGQSRMDMSTANAKLSHKSAVVLWGGTHLPHSLSNLFKTASEKAQVPISVLAPGQRSVASVCLSILKSWGVPVYEDLDH